MVDTSFNHASVMKNCKMGETSTLLQGGKKVLRDLLSSASFPVMPPWLLTLNLETFFAVRSLGDIATFFCFKTKVKKVLRA